MVQGYKQQSSNESLRIDISVSGEDSFSAVRQAEVPFLCSSVRKTRHRQVQLRDILKGAFVE